MHLIGPIKARLQRLYRSTLYMNAFYLMLATFVVAMLGLVFWIVVTRTYETAAVGLATTLISVSGLVSLLGLAGFDTTFVRFLPGSKRQNDYINSGLIVVTFMSGGLAVCLAATLPLLLPSLSILSSPWAFVGFVFFTVATSLNVLTNAVFLAFKQARYILVISILFSALKAALPLVVIQGDAMTIFVLAGSAQLVGVILSIMWMRRRCGYQFSPRLHLDTLRVVKKFSSSTYTSSVLNLLPPTLLPLIVVYHMGPENAAYYYMAFTLAGVLYTIAYASMQSAFAEGSHDELNLKAHVTKALKLIAILLLPSALLMAILSHFLLAVFGPEYASEASSLLQLLTLGALPVAVYSAIDAVFKVTKNLRGMISMHVIYAALIVGLSYLLVPSMGLLAVGWAWLIGNTAAGGIGALFLMKINNKRRGE